MNTSAKTGFKTTLLKESLRAHRLWYREIDFSFRAVFDISDFNEMLHRAGYNTDHLSQFGCFLVPVERAPILDAVRDILSDTDDPLLEWSAIYTAGLLDAHDLIPAIVHATRQDNEYSVAGILAIKTLIILRYPAPDLLPLIERLVERDGPSDALSYLSMHQMLQESGIAAAERAWDALCRFKDTESMSATLLHASEIHRRGVDTSALFDTMIRQESPRAHTVPTRAEWLFTVGTPHLFRDALDRATDTELVEEILCQAIEDSAKREKIRPVLIELESQLLARTAIGTSLLPLLRLCGVDVSKETESINWSMRCGAFLAEVTEEAPQRTGENYYSLLMQERDDEVRYALFLNLLLRTETPGLAAALEFDQRYQEAFPELPRITRAIVTGCKLGNRFPFVELDKRLSHHQTREQLRDLLAGEDRYVQNRLLVRLETWTQTLYDHFETVDPLDINLLLWVLDPDSSAKHIDRHMSELFLSAGDHSCMHTLSAIAQTRRILFDTPLGRIKQKVLCSNGKGVQLNQEEFDVLYPLLLKESVEWSFKLDAVRCSRDMLSAAPQKAMTLLRLGSLDHGVAEEIAALISPVEEDYLSTAIVAATKGVVDPAFPVLASLFGNLDTIVSPAVQGANAHLIDVHTLQELLSRSEKLSKETVQKLYDLLAAQIPPPELSAFFMHRADKVNWKEEESLATLIARQPDPVYAPLLKLLMENERHSIQKEALRAADQIALRYLKHIPVAHVTRKAEEQALKTVRSLSSTPGRHREYLDRKCIVTIVDITKLPVIADWPGKWVEIPLIWDLLLHMVVDYADEKSASLVVHIGPEETTETLFWLMETSTATLFAVQVL